MLSAPPRAKADPFIPGGCIYDRTNSYTVESMLKEGAFGKVAKCTRVNDNTTVAVKVMKKPGSYNRAVNEAQVLFQLKCLDADKCNIVDWHKIFTNQGCVFLVFEHLDKTLSDFMKQRNCNPLSLKEIRPVVCQLANALEHLRTLGLIHMNIKKENVMLVNHGKEPFRVKLIDFSGATHVSTGTAHSTAHTISYRSPEIILGLHFTQAIDMWCLGSLAAELYLGSVLYPGVNDYDTMRYIVETQGQPPDSMLDYGQRTVFFFNKVYTSQTSRWKLKAPGQYLKDTGIQSVENRLAKYCSLDGLLGILLLNRDSFADRFVEEADQLMFVDMLKGMLKLDASRRSTPCQVLDHNFVKMRHIVRFCRLSSLARSSTKIMDVCENTSTRGKPGLGAQDASSTKATFSNQQKIKAPTLPANSSKATQPNSFPTKPHTVQQSEVSKPKETNGNNNQHDRQKTFHVPKNVSNVGPQMCTDPKSNHTHLQRPTNALTDCGPGNKRAMADDGKDNFHERLEPKRKRARESGGTSVAQGASRYVERNALEIQPLKPSDAPSLEKKVHSQEPSGVGTIRFRSIGSPHIGSSLYSQNHLTSHPTGTTAGEMRQANGANPKPCTYNRTTQQGTKSDFKNHKNEKQAFLKSDMVNYKRKREDPTPHVGLEDAAGASRVFPKHNYTHLEKKQRR